MKVRITKGRLKKLSSRRWVERQLNDPFVAAAKKQGYRSRAAFKLIEIDDKFGLIKKARTVLDLGAAPGGWSQVAAERACGGTYGRKLVASDLLDIAPINGIEFVKGDFNDEEVVKRILDALGDKPDLILSDMSPNTVGHAKTDHIRIISLVKSAADFASNNLALGGSFVVKVFQGGGEQRLLSDLKTSFGKVAHFKPKSSRKESSELYLIATGFKK
ncbi:MAG: RlmE family RNA methyltransferase [Holosporales bacterium]|jgi:23S rRNA (uridine2552-2'-O)-methyltransferase|nr:RlmE family RNA methyltransferase [Holosporales bacterium]